MLSPPLSTIRIGDSTIDFKGNSGILRSSARISTSNLVTKWVYVRWISYDAYKYDNFGDGNNWVTNEVYMKSVWNDYYGTEVDKTGIRKIKPRDGDQDAQGYKLCYTTNDKYCDNSQVTWYGVPYLAPTITIRFWEDDTFSGDDKISAEHTFSLPVWSSTLDFYYTIPLTRDDGGSDFYIRVSYSI